MKTVFNKKNISIYILSFVIPFFSVLIGLIAGGYAPFGSKNILTASGYNDYLPYYYELYDRIHEGVGLGYSSHSGLGYDFTSLVTYFISDPLNFLILAFPRNSIISVLNILYIIKIGFSGSFMSMFFVYKKSKIIDKQNTQSTIEEDTNKKEKKKSDFIIGFQKAPSSSIIRFIMSYDWFILSFSVAYSLSLTMIGIGMNIAFIGAIAIFPLIMLGIDLLIYEDNIAFLIISLTISIYCNLHISIITGIFIIFYIITREYDDIEQGIKSIFKVMISIVISTLSSFVIIFCSIQGGFFTANNSLFFPSVNIDNYMNTFRQLMSQGILSYISMYGTYDISVSILAIFLIFCYLFQKNIKISSKIKNLCLLFFILSGTFLSTTRYLFNGMNLNAQNQIHFGYIICFLFLNIAFEELHSIDKTKPIVILVSFILSTIIAFLPMFLADGYDNSAIFIKTLEFLFGYFLLLMIYSNKSMTKTLFRTLISLILLIEIIIPNVTNITNTGKFYTSQKLDNVKPIQLYEAAKALHDREENISVLIYNSSESYENPLTATLSGYDYIINTNKSNPYGYMEPTSISKKENSAITVNTYKTNESFKYFYYPKSIINYTYNLQHPFESSNQLSSFYLNGEDIFELIDINVEPSAAADGLSASFNVVSNENLSSGYVFFNAYYTSYIFDASNINQGFTIQNIPKSNDLNIKYAYTGAILNKTNLDNLSSECSIININDDNSVTIQANSDGYISTGFNNIKTLNFFVNNKKVKPISKINNNALVPVNSGENIIKVKYSYNTLIISIIVSIFSIIFTLLSLISKKNKKNESITEKIKNNINMLIKFVTNNFVYVISIMIILFVFILCQMITSSQPFGVYSVIKDDGIVQYFPNFLNTINCFNMPFTLTSYTSCGFQDVIRYIIDMLIASPYSISYLGIKSSNTLLSLYTFFYILYLIMPAVTIIYYLTHKQFNKYNKTDRRLIVYALLYSLSSYSAVLFQYCVGFRIPGLLPLIILGIEQMIYNKKPALYICLLAYYMIINPYCCFLLCEFLVFYFCLMRFDSIHDFFKKGLRFSGISILTALISAFSLLPFYYSTKQSPYLTTDNKVPSILKFYTSYIKQIAEYHTCNTIKTISDNDAQTASYCGLIMLFVIPLYILNEEIALKSKIKRIFLILLLFLSTNNELLNYIMHGFHFQTLVPNRFAIFIIFLLILTLADSNIGKYIYNKKYFLIGILTALGLVFSIYLHTYTEPSITINITFILLGLYSIATILSYKKTDKQHYILYIAIADIIINSFFIFSMNIGSKTEILKVSKSFNSISEANPETKDFSVLTEYITDDSAYKNIGKLTSLNTLSFFDSAITQENMDYISFYNVATGSNSITYNSNPLADMMLKIRYHIVNQYNENSISVYPAIYQQNEYTLHQNPNYIGLGFVHSNNESSDEYVNNLKKSNYKNSFDYQNAIVKYLGGNDIYTILDCTDQFSTLNVYYSIGETYTTNDLHFRDVRYAPITMHFPSDFNGNIYMDILGKIKYIGTVNEENHILSYDYPINKFVELDKFKPCIAVYNEKAMYELSNHLSKGLLYNTSQKCNTISSSIDADNDGTIYISLPFYEGWDIYVDGIKTDKFKYLGGIGINVSKGNHKILMKYHSPYALLGLIISLSTILLNILFIAIKHKIHINKIDKSNI